MSDELLLPETIETVPEALIFWAERTPNAPALRSASGRELSHGELHQAIDRISNRLLALEIERQQRVALILPAGFDMCVALLGTMAAAVAMPLNPA
jgi:acyl-CoA synthetase (AMP-forming)/AMP-acid ligase II